MKAYGFCKAGCKREVVLRSDYEKSAPLVKIDYSRGTGGYKRRYELERYKTYRVVQPYNTEWDFEVRLVYSSGTEEGFVPLEIDIPAANIKALMLRFVSAEAVKQEDGWSIRNFAYIHCGAEFNVGKIYAVEVADLDMVKDLKLVVLSKTDDVEVFLVNSDLSNIAEKGDSAPVVTSDDNGKVMSVVNGEWVAVGIEETKGFYEYFAGTAENVKMPDGITSVREYCFYGFSELKNVNIPEGTKVICKCAFYNTPLNNVELPASVNEVKESAFEGCKNITEIILPAKVEVYKNAFADCSNLKSIRFSGKPSAINNNAFIGCNSVTDIYVPWNEGEVSGVPWGANNATIHYKVTKFVSIEYGSSENWSYQGTINGVTYTPHTGSMITKNGALVFERGDTDSLIFSTLGNVASMYSDRVNYDIVLSLNGDNLPPSFDVELRSRYLLDGTMLSSSYSLFLCRIQGYDVFLGYRSVKIATLTNERLHLRISVDFRHGTISYCDEHFNPITTISFTVDTKSDAPNVNQWRSLFKSELFRLRAHSTGHSIRIYSIDVQEGAIDYTLFPDTYFYCFPEQATAGVSYNGYFIKSFLGISPTVIIPKTCNGKTVEGISENAFNKTIQIKGGQIFFPNTLSYLRSKSLTGGGFKEVFVPWSETKHKGALAPWGATDATIHYDYDTSGFYD